MPVGASSGEHRFWELLWLGTHAARWSLVTPPGVQDNGGLSIALAARGVLTAGFLPSINLHFSPLARTPDHGATWSPELLPDGLAIGPDSLAAGAGEALLALISRRSGEVLKRSGPHASWKRLVSAAELARQLASNDCELESIDAVSASSEGHPLVGGSCQRPGQIGEYTYDHGSWRRAAPDVPKALRGYTAAVLRLKSTPVGVYTLIELTSPSNRYLITAWSSDSGKRWRELPALRLPANQQVISAGPGLGNEAYVLTGIGKRADSLWVSAGPGSAWRANLAPPAGTAAVALSGNAAVTAFAVHGRTIDVWQLEKGSRSWRREQTTPVSISEGEG